jgi:hypothetical protein
MEPNFRKRHGALIENIKYRTKM